MMGKHLPAGSMFIDRRIFLNTLTAIYVSQLKTEDISRNEVYVTGYHEGYFNALLAMAAAMGVIEEFSTSAQGARKIIAKRAAVNGFSG